MRLDAGPVPTEFNARTVNVYACPFVNPITVHDNAPQRRTRLPPGDDVTW